MADDAEHLKSCNATEPLLGDGDDQTLVLDDRAIADLLDQMPRRRPYDLNAILAAAEAITKRGFTQPIILSTIGRILHGELRLDAARWLDLETVPCLVLTSTRGSDARCLAEVLGELSAAGAWSLNELIAAYEARRSAYEALALDGFPPLDLDAAFDEPYLSDGADDQVD